MAGLPPTTGEMIITADNKLPWKGGIITRTGELAENQPNLTPAPNSAALAGKMICMNGKVYK